VHGFLAPLLASRLSSFISPADRGLPFKKLVFVYCLDLFILYNQYEEDVQRIIDEANNMGPPKNVNGSLVQTFMSQMVGDVFHAMQCIIARKNHDFKAALSFARCHISHGLW
jgi:hypothetical protein